MFKKALALIMIVTGAGMVGLLDPSPVDATGHSATRSFSADTVAPGGKFDVTIEVANLGQYGQVVETLPDGFSYVDGSASPSGDVGVEMDGQEVTFTLFLSRGVNSFTYSVTASSVEDDHTFQGRVLDETFDSRDVGGDNGIKVEAGAVTPSPSPTQPPAPEGLHATRILPDAAVDAGSEFDVTIEVANLGQYGQVVETLPAGFSYVDGSAPSDQVGVEMDGQEVTFTLFLRQGVNSFSYSVMASDLDDDYTFSGVIKDSPTSDAVPVGGDSSVTVGSGAAMHSATRSFSDSTVEPGGQVVVTIEVANLGQYGQVTETLPAGFSYLAGSASPSGDIGFEMDGQEVEFTLFLSQGVNSFTYTVTASSVEDDHTFSGVVLNQSFQSMDVGGDDTVTVAVPPTPTPSPTPVTPTASPTAAPSPTTGVSVTTARVPTLTVGGSSSRVNLPSIFSEIETDGLTYTAISSRTSVVRARVSGIILRLTPGGAGTSRITVTATDDDGNETRRTFTVRVRAAELPPVGDLTAPDWLLALLALAGAALVPVGVLTLRSRRRRAAP